MTSESMSYLKLMSGEKVQLTEEQTSKLKYVLTTKNPPKFFLLGNNLINTSTVAGILEDELAKEKVRTLKDGTRAVERFGLWYDADNPEVQLNLAYYPELKSYDVHSNLQQLTDGLRPGNSLELPNPSE